MDTLIEILGWTLIHFLWQGAIAASLLWGTLCILRNSQPRWRYFASGLTICAMLASAIATGILEWGNVAPAPVQQQGKIARPTRANSEPNVARIPIASPTKTLPTPLEQLTTTTRNPLPETPAASVSLMPWVVAIWAIGVAIFSFGFLRSWLGLRRIRSTATKVADTEVKNTFSKLLEQMRIRSKVALLATGDAVVPMVVGWLQPAIIVPIALLNNLPAWQVEAILAHELAHVRRHDYLINLFQSIVETVFFYHPLVWWVSAQLRKEREHCCDDAAARISGGAIEYAKALTALEELRVYTPAVATAASGSSLLGRIRRLLGVPQRESGSSITWPIGIAAAAVTASLIVSSHLVHAADDEEKLDDARTEVHESAYKSSEPITERHKGILWSKPNEVGLQLGIDEVAPDKKIQIGAIDSVNPARADITIPHLYLRNDGNEEIKLSVSGQQNRGLGGVLVDGDGKRHASQFLLMPNAPQRYEIAPNQLTAIKLSHDLSFRVEPGTYKLELTCGIGRCFDGSYKAKMPTPMAPGWLPGEDEWIGQLTSLPIAIKITAAARPSIHIAKPGDFNRWHFDANFRLEFVNGKITLGGMDQLPGRMTSYAKPNDEWLSQAADGDYRIAWKGRAKDGFWAVDGKSVYHLQIGPADPPTGGHENKVPRYAFFIAGDWPLNQAQKAIPGLTAPIREALELAARDLVLGMSPDHQTARIEIRKPGKYRITQWISAEVRSEELAGELRNTLKLTSENEDGEIVTDSCALPFGENTWGVQVSDYVGRRGVAIVSILSKWGAMQFLFQNYPPLDPGFSGPHACWQITAADLYAGRIPQFTDPEIFAWSHRSIFEIEAEELKFFQPGFEVRPVATDDEEPELIRPTYWQRHGGYQRIGRFVRLGERLLADGEAVVTGASTGGVVRYHIGVNEESQPKFHELCKKYEGRRAAVIWNGMVSNTFELTKGMTSFSSSYAFPQPKVETAKLTYEGLPFAKWDQMLGKGGVRQKDREALQNLGFGKLDKPVPEAAIPMLLALAHSGEPVTKCRSLGTLSKIENPWDVVLAAYITALKDPSAGIRSRAGHLLGRQPERALFTVPRLIALVENKDNPEAQAAAVFALERIGPPAKGALPALQHLRKDAPEALREAIDKATKAIRSRPKE